MRCCIIPIAAHRPTRLRRTGTIPSTLFQFFDPTPYRHRDIPMAGHEHDWNSNIRLRQLGLEVETAQPRQSDVEHQTTGNIWTPALEELRSRFECLDPQPYGMEEPGERLAHRRVVVHYEDDRLVRAPIGI